MYLAYPQQQFEEKQFFWRFCFFLGFWTKFLSFIANETQWGCWNFVLRVQKVIFLVRKTYKSTKVYFSRFPSQNDFAETSWQRCQRCTCTVHSNILWRNSSLMICFFFFLGNWMKNLCLSAKETKPSCQKFVLGVQRMYECSGFSYLKQEKRGCENFLSDWSKVYLQYRQ